MKHLKACLVAGMTLAAFSGVVHGKESEKDAARPRMNVRKVMTQFDKDKNGKIDGTEAEALRKAFEGDLKSQLSKYDRDGNGKLDDAEIERYWQTGEPCDKAGGYAIQGYGAVFVTELVGSYSGVMGLPLHEPAGLLIAAGVPLWHARTS